MLLHIPSEQYKGTSGSSSKTIKYVGPFILLLNPQEQAEINFLHHSSIKQQFKRNFQWNIPPMDRYNTRLVIEPLKYQASALHSGHTWDTRTGSDAYEESILLIPTSVVGKGSPERRRRVTLCVSRKSRT